MGTNEGEKHIYKLGKTRKMKTKELNGVWCIKDKVLGVLVKEDLGVFVKEEPIQERWKSYFNKLFNGNNMKYWSNLSNQMKDINYRFVWRIRMIAVNDALRRMKMEKDVGPNEISLLNVCISQISDKKLSY